MFRELYDMIPDSSRRRLRRWLMPALESGRQRAQELFPSNQRSAQFGDNRPCEILANPLRTYFEHHVAGPGIWKWEHYFDIYHRHLQKFVGREVNLLEIGVYSGGSLEMWRTYFGPKCHVYGVDIEPACKAYETEEIGIFIGDQSDRGFWRRFREMVPELDIVIDDGGHLAHQQIVTLEETLPYLNADGVYMCEDICKTGNDFHRYLSGFSDNLNAAEGVDRMNPEGPHEALAATPFQSAVHSVHFYPYLAVIEKHALPSRELVSSRRGTQWQPFYHRVDSAEAMASKKPGSADQAAVLKPEGAAEHF
jgi:hypothetical protein